MAMDPAIRAQLLKLLEPLLHGKDAEQIFWFLRARLDDQDVVSPEECKGDVRTVASRIIGRLYQHGLLSGGKPALAELLCELIQQREVGEQWGERIRTWASQPSCLFEPHSAAGSAPSPATPSASQVPSSKVPDPLASASAVPHGSGLRRMRLTLRGRIPWSKLSTVERELRRIAGHDSLAIVEASYGSTILLLQTSADGADRLLESKSKTIHGFEITSIEPVSWGVEEAEEVEGEETSGVESPALARETPRDMQLAVQRRRKNGTHIVLLVHGIRTAAVWAERVRAVLESGRRVIVHPIRYGYLDALRFWFPWTRRPFIERVEREIRSALHEYPRERLSVIAHSFGTYAIGNILSENPDIHVHRLILCGSILKEEFPWNRVRPQLDEPVVSDCGTRDIWPVMAKISSWGYGCSGTFGFGTISVRDRFHDMGHSGFLTSEFAEKFWKPWIQRGVLVCSAWDLKRPNPPLWLQCARILPLKTVLAVVVLLLVSLFWWFTKAPARSPEDPAPPPEAPRQTAGHTATPPGPVGQTVTKGPDQISKSDHEATPDRVFFLAEKFDPDPSGAGGWFLDNDDRRIKLGKLHHGTKVSLVHSIDGARLCIERKPEKPGTELPYGVLLDVFSGENSWENYRKGELEVEFVPGANRQQLAVKAEYKVPGKRELDWESAAMEFGMEMGQTTRKGERTRRPIPVDHLLMSNPKANVSRLTITENLESEPAEPRGFELIRVVLRAKKSNSH